MTRRSRGSDLIQRRGECRRRPHRPSVRFPRYAGIAGEGSIPCSGARPTPEQSDSAATGTSRAPKYDKQVAFFERWLLGDGRHWVCSQATGDVLEVAIGTGRNLPFYPGGIRLTGTDFSPAMLELARRQADQLGRRVDLRLGDAQALELPDACFDTVVCTLSLCAIPDERRAVAEMQRVLRPGGRLLLLDHVARLPRWLRAIQWLLELVMGPTTGDHQLRHPLLEVQAEGLEVERRERSKLGMVERLAARKPPEEVGGPRAAAP